MSNGSTSVSLHCWANNVQQFDPSYILVEKKSISERIEWFNFCSIILEQDFNNCDQFESENTHFFFNLT